MKPGRARRLAFVVPGVLAILVGGTWMGQGLNLIPGSFMTGDKKWFVIGAVVVLAGVLLIFLSLDRGRRPGQPPR